MELSGLLLMFFLGLRHGFDPDHIAIIDGVSVRFSAAKPQLAKWTGTLFALGHGTVVTSVAVLISSLSHAWEFPALVWQILDWVPGILLIVVGLMNLRMLKRAETYKPTGIKWSLIPARLKNSSNPLAIVAIGILFAMVFDTNTQAAAWAYTATSKLNTLTALLLGFSFSAGMIITDTLDSRILFSLMNHSTNNDSVLGYRRKLGWIIVIVSLSVGTYKIFTHLFPVISLNEDALTIIGVSFFVLMGIFYCYVLYNDSLKPKSSVDGN